MYSIYMFLTHKERKIYLKERIRHMLGKVPSRINYGRYIYFRDKDRFE